MHLLYRSYNLWKAPGKSSCDCVNDLRHSLFHLLNCFITTASKFFLELRNNQKSQGEGLDYREGDELSWGPSRSNSLWRGWSCGLVNCPGGNATVPIWRVLASSDGISFWNPLKPQYSIPCWLYVLWEPSACRSYQWCQKKDHQMFVGGFALSGLLGPGRASILPLGTLSLGLWVIIVDPAFIAGHQSIKDCRIWIDQLDHLPAISTTSFWSSLSTLGTNFAQIFRIFSSSGIIVCTVPTLTSNCALIVSKDTRRSLSMKFFIWPINSGVLTSLLLHHLLSFLTDPVPSLNLLCHSKTDARFTQARPKAVRIIPHVSVVFCPSLKQDFIAYRSSQVSSCPDCILKFTSCDNQAVFQLMFIWTWNHKNGQSSHDMCSNNIVNIQESTTILNACTK